MRVLTVEPGPNFSVVDVHRGWVKALRNAGHTVGNLNFGARLEFYERAKDTDTGELFTTEQAVRMAADGLLGACYKLWPDVVIVTSGFYVPDDVLDLMRARGHKIVLLHTESPYEDDKQIARAAHADVNIVNDPTNVHRFPDGAIYIGHAYDPDVHHPGGDGVDEFDVCFVGTGYPSRVAFLEAVDWTGLRVALAGNWGELAHDSPLAGFLIHDRSECWPNELAADLYRRSTVSLNLYRREAHHADLVDGWAMGPREVELAATGVFYMTEARGENRQVLPMVPTFDSPDEFGDKVRWWLGHPEARADVVRDARAAVADRTFDNNVRRLTQQLNRDPATPILTGA